MIITRGTLTNLGVGFNATFKAALQGVTSQRALIATEVPSTTSSNEYGWLNSIPAVRQWIGDRVVHRLEASAYTIRNLPWELTLGVKRDDIEDDNLGVYTPILQGMANNTGNHEDQISFDMLKNGFSQACYDGQYFFDTDHPIKAEDGTDTVFANTDGGSGDPWFIIAINQPIMPVIFQRRRGWNFVSKDAPNDEGVFWQGEFNYGADARHNVGYGLPQTCWGSKQTLDDTHFNTGIQKLMEMKRDGGQRIGNVKFRLVVPPSKRAAAKALVELQYLAGGASNPNYLAAELVVAPWLA